jgi:hypothetical protein
MGGFLDRTLGRRDADRRTTHVKAGWIQRNGVPASDRAIITEHIVRHGDVLTLVSVVDDPIYLEEPLVRSTTGAKT